MSTLTTLALFLASLVLGWAFWFIVRFLQYLRSGEYEIDQRLHQICK
jgi:hypothetical protein